MGEDGQLDEVPATGERRPSAELVKRVISGLVFAAIAIGLAWAGLVYFALLVLAISLVMSWEWARVVRARDFDLTLLVHAVAMIAAVALTVAGLAALGLAVVMIAAIIVLPLEFGQRPLFAAAGVFYTGLPAVAILWLRSSEPMGFLAVLLIFLTVWATDTAAFLAGRLIGGPKLLPSISPNKTWSGLAGGVLAASLTAGLTGYATGNPVPALAALGLVMGLVAQAGDLIESAVKRTFGAKDASNLIPGHGGFMDRLDGIVTVSVAAALAALFVNARAPAEALISGL